MHTSNIAALFTTFCARRKPGANMTNLEKHRNFHVFCSEASQKNRTGPHRIGATGHDLVKLSCTHVVFQVDVTQMSLTLTLHGYLKCIRILIVLIIFYTAHFRVFSLFDEAFGSHDVCPSQILEALCHFVSLVH